MKYIKIKIKEGNYYKIINVFYFNKYNINGLVKKNIGNVLEIKICLRHFLIN